jgi:hypothetical protein
VVEKLHEEGGFEVGGDGIEGVGDGADGFGEADLDGDGVVEHVFGEGTDVVGHGGGEEEGLPIGGKVLEDAADVGEEAHVEHVVGFVEDEDFYVGEDDVALGEVVEEASGAGDHDVDAFAEFFELHVGADAAVDGDAAQAGCLAEDFDGVACLLGKLTGGGEDEGADVAARAVEQTLEDGEDEGGGFAGAGLGKAYQVTTLEGRGDGLELDGGGELVACGVYALHYLRVEVKRLKIHYYVSPLW